MQTLKIDLAAAKKLYPGANSELQGMLEKEFGKEPFIPVDIMGKVKTFDDILLISGRTMNSLISEGDTPDIVAYKKIRLIAEVYNQGTHMDVLNTDQWKYWPWFKVNSGSGLSYGDRDLGYSSSRVGSRLCFKSEELAIDAGKKFIDIYTDYLTK